MIKVVHITSNITGGAGIAALRLHRSLRSISDIDSSILQKGDTPFELTNENITTLYESKEILYRIKRKLNLTPEKKQRKLISTYSKNYEYEIATFPTTSYKIENHPLVKKADIIHLHWVANFLNYPTFFKKVKKPIVWTLHDMNPFQGIFHYKNDIINNADIHGVLEGKICIEKRKYIHQTNCLNVVTPSAWLSNLSKKSNSLKLYPHHVIANGIDFDKYPTPNYKDAKLALNIDSNKLTILFVAHSVEIIRKGFDILLEAIDSLKCTNFNLISVGGDKIEIDSTINHIHFNYISDIKILNQTYQAADITIIPSREDNLPNIMLESFANGTPVISFANGGMAEHIKTGENGISVEEIGAEPLKEAIEDFLTNKYTFDREKIRQYAKDHFDQKQQALKYVELYHKILNR